MGQNQPQTAKRNSPILLILLVLLGVLLAALGYDQLVARPAVTRAQQELEGKIIAQNSAPGDSAIFTPAQVHEFIGHDPVDGMQEHNGYKYEEYRWMAGLPVRSYNLVVVYQGEKKPRLAAVFSNKPAQDGIGELHSPDNTDMDVEVPPAALETGDAPKRPTPGEKGSGEEKGKGSGKEKTKEAGKPDYKSEAAQGDAEKKPDAGPPREIPAPEKKPADDAAPTTPKTEGDAPAK